MVGFCCSEGQLDVICNLCVSTDAWQGEQFLLLWGTGDSGALTLAPSYTRGQSTCVLDVSTWK